MDVAHFFLCKISCLRFTNPILLWNVPPPQKQFLQCICWNHWGWCCSLRCGKPDTFRQDFGDWDFRFCFGSIRSHLGHRYVLQLQFCTNPDRINVFLGRLAILNSSSFFFLPSPNHKTNISLIERMGLENLLKANKICPMELYLLWFCDDYHLPSWLASLHIHDIAA